MQVRGNICGVHRLGDEIDAPFRLLPRPFECVEVWVLVGEEDGHWGTDEAVERSAEATPRTPATRAQIDDLACVCALDELLELRQDRIVDMQEVDRPAHERGERIPEDTWAPPRVLNLEEVETIHAATIGAMG
jgi:hypothetical protein